MAILFTLCLLKILKRFQGISIFSLTKYVRLQVSIAVLKAYIGACGVKYFIVLLVLLMFYIASQVATDLWISDWSNESARNITVAQQNSHFRLGIYAVFIGCQGASLNIDFFHSHLFLLMLMEKRIMM